MAGLHCVTPKVCLLPWGQFLKKLRGHLNLSPPEQGCAVGVWSNLEGGKSTGKTEWLIPESTFVVLIMWLAMGRGA